MSKKDKYISRQIEFEVEDGSMTAEEFSNMFNQSLADQFKRIQNIKGKTHTTISTTVNPGEDHAAWETFKINAPVLEDVSENIDKILGDSDLMKDINELVIRDTQELYVRELLNRVKELQAEVQEANDNAAWWHNRYTAMEKRVCSRSDCAGRIKDGKKIDSVQQRIERAIKLLENNQFIWSAMDDEILKILKGESNE